MPVLNVPKLSLGVSVLALTFVVGKARGAVMLDDTQYFVSAKNLLGVSLFNVPLSHYTSLVFALGALFISIYEAIKDNSQVFQSFVTHEKALDERAKIIGKYAADIKSLKDEFKAEAGRLSVAELQTVFKERGIAFENQEKNVPTKEQYLDAVCDDFSQRMDGFETMSDAEHVSLRCCVLGNTRLEKSAAWIVSFMHDALIERNEEIRKIRERTIGPREVESSFARRKKHVKGVWSLMLFLNIVLLVVILGKFQNGSSQKA